MRKSFDGLHQLVRSTWNWMRSEGTCLSSPAAGAIA
jgi:hypothetical protein